MQASKKMSLISILQLSEANFRRISIGMQILPLKQIVSGSRPPAFSNDRKFRIFTAKKKHQVISSLSHSLSLSLSLSLSGNFRSRDILSGEKFHAVRLLSEVPCLI